MLWSEEGPAGAVAVLDPKDVDDSGNPTSRRVCRAGRRVNVDFFRGPGQGARIRSENEHPVSSYDPLYIVDGAGADCYQRKRFHGTANLGPFLVEPQ